MAYNASQLESWGHYRDGGGSYYENIASTVKPSQSSHSRIQGYVEPSRTRNGDGYQREAYHPENVAQHQRELDAWSRGGGGGGPSTAAPRSGKEWYGDASYNAPALPMAGHTTHADEYNPYGSRTVALKADFQNRRPRSRSVSPQSKRQRQDSTAQYGYGGRGGQEKAEYGSGWNEAGGYGGAAGGYERQMQRTAPHGGSMRDSSNQRSSSQYYQATPAAAATQASPTRFRGSNAQLGVQASPYSYNTGAAASTSYYPTTTYFTQRSPTNIRPARIGRPVIQQNIRRDLNAPSRSPVKPAPPPRREVKPPPPVKKSTTSSSTYKPAPKTSTTAGKTSEPSSGSSSKSEAKKERLRRRAAKRRESKKAEEATSGGKTTAPNNMRRPSDKVPADTSTPDVIILKTSKKEGEAKGGKGAGAGKPKPGFFSRVLTKTDGVATATKEGESASGQTAESKAVKPVAPQSSSVSDKPTTSAPAVFKEPVVDVANFKKPNAPAAAKPAGVPGAPRLKPSQLEFHVTPHMIKIKHPYGTWSAWSNRQKIAAIRWLSAYPEGKEPGRLQEWQMPAEQWWPYFEDGAWIVPVAHRETGGAPVHEKVVTAEPLPIKAAVSGVQESVKGGEQEKKTEGGEEVDNAKTADKVVTATNVEDVKEAAPRESSPEFNTPVGNNTTDVEMQSGKAEKEGSGVISGKDGDEDEDVVLDSA